MEYTAGLEDHLEDALGEFGYEAIYTTPGGAKKISRVMIFVDQVLRGGETPISVPQVRAVARASDFEEVQDSGSTPTIEIESDLWYITDVQTSGTGRVDLILSKLDR